MNITFSITTYKNICRYTLNVYDPDGLVAYTVDGNMRADGKCRFMLYDAIARPVVTGVCDIPEADAPRMRATYKSAEVGMDSTGYVTDVPLANAEVYTATYYDYGGFYSPRYLDDIPAGYVPSVGTDTKVAYTLERVLGSSPRRFAATVYEYDYEERVIKTAQTFHTPGVCLITENEYNIDDTVSATENRLYHLLGNVRAVVSRDGGTTVFDQTTYYYPYGLPMAESTSPQANPYKYTAKELLTDQSLNLADHGARFYDPAIARWISTAPLGYENPEYTLYNMVFSDPIRFVDMTGLIGWDAVENFLSFLPDEVRSHTMTLLKGVVEKDGVALSRIAVGVERNRTLSATSGAQLEASFVNGVVMFLGGDDAGYLYTYIGGEFGGGAEAVSAGLNLNGSMSVFIAIQNDVEINHISFAGKYNYANISITGNVPFFGITSSVGVSVGSHTNPTQAYWTVYSRAFGADLSISGSSPITLGTTFGGGNVLYTPNQSVGLAKSSLEKILSLSKSLFILF